MDETQFCHQKHAGFAVVRNYAPARIEHELLARVLGILGPGPGSERLEPADMFGWSAPVACTTVGSESMEHQRQPLALEPAA
jgi:hypothetical protein